jgi:hypothetical protein
MPAVKHMGGNSQAITYLTPPTRVSMSDFWYDIANLRHFWIRRRFEILQYLADPIIRQAVSIAEIGCGNGLVQRQLEDHYGIKVTGFDLNEQALKQNQSRISPLYCYDIHQRSPEFRGKFDVVLLFDVLEHIEDEKTFLESVKYHMTGRGRLIVNVPAHQFFYSAYDRAVGHVRRYSRKNLARAAASGGFRIVSFSYWGLSMMPLLLLRKVVIGFRRNEKAVISGGLDPRTPALNTALMFLARCEALPQKMAGTSLMMVFERSS